MALDLERFFTDVFAPRDGDVLTIMYDLPHSAILDREEWRARREMAESWREGIAGFADPIGLTVNPIVTYAATGTHNGDLPELGVSVADTVRLEDVVKDSTIVIAMTEYSASAPLFGLAKRFDHVRIASMPMVARSMEETALAADYRDVAATCARLAPLFERAEGIEVTFSTGHRCDFDTSNHNAVFRDNGLLHPVPGDYRRRIGNLPAGEVCICPNESEDSGTAGEIPAVMDGEDVVFTVERNRIVDVAGGAAAERLRRAFADEPALRGIAEVAIGVNDRAVVTGNVLEDEKAGFHWAYGRSDHLGGTVGPSDFSAPDRVFHRDIVYAKGNPIVCASLDFVFPDGSRTTAVLDGKLVLDGASPDGGT